MKASHLADRHSRLAKARSFTFHTGVTWSATWPPAR
jgi:hypothetical protein